MSVNTQNGSSHNKVNIYFISIFLLKSPALILFKMQLNIMFEKAKITNRNTMLSLSLSLSLSLFSN